MSQTQQTEQDKETLKARMERLHRAMLLKKLLVATNLDGLDNQNLQELLDRME